MAQRKVVFVCLHGAAKSVIAAELFNRRSAEARLDARAVALGVEPDADVSPAAATGLLGEGIDVRGQRPRAATAADLAGASCVVAFACDLSAIAPPGLSVEQWPEIPAVSDGYAAARDRIADRVERVIADLGGQRRS
jgi:protein-tyrosine-phosphatase